MLCSWFKPRVCLLAFSLPLSSPSLLHLNSVLASHFSNLWGKQRRIVGDIFFKVMTSLICNGAGVLKAVLSLPLSAAGSQLSNLVIHPYQLSELPLPLGCHPRNARRMWSCCLAPSVPHTQHCARHRLISAELGKQAQVSRYWVSTRSEFSSY